MTWWFLSVFVSESDHGVKFPGEFSGLQGKCGTCPGNVRWVSTRLVEGRTGTEQTWNIRVLTSTFEENKKLDKLRKNIQKYMKTKKQKNKNLCFPWFACCFVIFISFFPVPSEPTTTQEISGRSTGNLAGDARDVREMFGTCPVVGSDGTGQNKKNNKNNWKIIRKLCF